MAASISLSDHWSLAAIVIAMVLGGILKGATGAGVPIIAVPVIAAVYDLKVAVAVMIVPNLISNAWQIYKYRTTAVDKIFCWQLALFGALGAGLGTIVLAGLPLRFLTLCMAAIIISYILLRLVKPNVHLSMQNAKKFVAPAFLFAGVLQGAVGVSAPIAVTFLTAMKLTRSMFIFTVSIFFASMAILQIPVQIHYGLMTRDVALLGLFAFLPLLVALPAGDWIGSRISPKAFEMVILTFLGLLALRLILAEVL